MIRKRTDKIIRSEIKFLLLIIIGSLVGYIFGVNMGREFIIPSVFAGCFIGATLGIVSARKAFGSDSSHR